MGDFKGSYLTPFPFLRAIYLTCLWTKQSMEYEETCKEVGDLTLNDTCLKCGGPTKKASNFGPWCHLDRFTDTLNYCRSTRTKLFGIL